MNINTKIFMFAFLMFALLGMVFAVPNLSNAHNEGNATQKQMQANKAFAENMQNKDFNGKKEFVKQRVKEIRAKLKERHKIHPIKQLRVLNTKVREQYQKRKNKYLKARNNYLKAKNEFLKLKHSKGNIRKLLKTAEGKEKTKNFLNTFLDRVVKRLEFIKINFADNNNYKDYNLVMTNLDDYISQLKSDKEKLNSLEDANEIIDFAKQLKTDLKEISVKTRTYTALLISNKLENTLLRFDNIIDKVKIKINDLNNDNYNAKFEEITKAYALVKPKLMEAETHFRNATKSENPREELKEGHKALREANKELRSVYKDLRTLVKDILKHKQSKEE